MDNVPIDPDSDRPSLAAHSTLWWSLGLAAFGALLALAYPTVRDNSELDKTFAGLPPGVQAALTGPPTPKLERDPRVGSLR